MISKNITSESVSDGHPDKIADQISDAILDSLLSINKNSRVAAETVVGNNFILLAGEISGNTKDLDYSSIVSSTLKNIYGDVDIKEFYNYELYNKYTRQNIEIAMAMNQNSKKMGSGDQGIVYGYASDDTDALMPASIYYAQQIMLEHSKLRKGLGFNKIFADAKSQVTANYIDGELSHLSCIVVSTQHHRTINRSDVADLINTHIINKVIPKNLIAPETFIIINPAGVFVNGGPNYDSGMSGRKIIADSFGSGVPHGGGAFSGKDGTKIDRSGAYACRYIAKNIVAAKLAKKCLLSACYAIGIPEVIDVQLESYGTGVISDEELLSIVKQEFDFSPSSILETLNLLNPIYTETTNFGHFGRANPNFKWEQIDLVDKFKNKI